MTWRDRLLQRLFEIESEDDRAALAALRRSLNQESHSFAGAARVIARVLPNNLGRLQEENAYLLAGLFALAPSQQGQPLPEALRVVAEAGSSSIELRFTALLAAEREDLQAHLRHAVTLVRSKELDIDWTDLFESLNGWGHPDGYVQKRWARHFWGTADGALDSPNTTEEHRS